MGERDSAPPSYHWQIRPMLASAQLVEKPKDFPDVSSFPGAWEPTYDRALWQSQNKLSLFFQPVGLGADSSPVSVLTWDAKAYFAKLQPK